MNIGKRLTELRSSKGWSTNRLAKEAGIAQSAMRSIEREEKSPTLDTLTLILNALDITMAEFFAPDLMDKVMAKMESMPKTAEEQAAYEAIKKMPLDKRQQSFMKTVEKLKSLPTADQEALAKIIDSLSASSQ